MRWKKAKKQASNPTASETSRALTQLQLRLRLLASTRSRPAAETHGTRSTPRPPSPSPHPSKPRLRERPLSSLRTEFRFALVASEPSLRTAEAALPAVHYSSSLPAPLDSAFLPRNATGPSAGADADEADAGGPRSRARVAG